MRNLPGGVMKIKTKLLLLLIIVGLLPLLGSSYLSYKSAQEGLTAQVYDQLNSSNTLMEILINTTLSNIEKEFNALADAEFTYRLYSRLLEYHNHPVLGPREPLSDGIDTRTPEYTRIWEEDGREITQYVNSLGYTKTYLICRAHGHVMYASDRNDIFAGQNLRAGVQSNSNLSKIWKMISDSEKTEILDFSHDAGGNKGYVGYIGAPVKNREGRMLGLLVTEIPKKNIEDSVATTDGMGETGASFILGRNQDGILLRSGIARITADNPRLIAGAALPGNCLDSSFNTNMSEGHCYGLFGGTRDIIYRTEKVNVPGLDWRVVTIKNEAEAFKAVNDAPRPAE
jgi:hypothetical protein